jgi:NitT/TauT family transport system ATP-binding protein
MAAPAAQSGLPIDLERVTRVFRSRGHADVAAVEDLSLRVGAGEFTALVGPSGCGKSTLLRMVAGLEHPDRGLVQVGAPLGSDPIGDPGGRPLAYVFQDAHLLPWRDVLDNVRLPLELAGVPKRESREAAAPWVSRVGLGEALRRYPAQLSGGMRMRASLARALVSRPRVLLLDEPFGALDEITRHGLQEQLRELWRAEGITVLFVTHSLAEATFLAERVVVLSPRPARIVLDHRVALPLERDAALRTDAAFASELRTLQAALRSGAPS